MCGKVFYVLPCFSSRKYCSMECERKAISKKAPTSLEKKVIDIINKYNLPFKFVGNKAFWIGWANPDFVHLEQKKVIEVFGNHWPKGNVKYSMTEAGRKRWYTLNGYGSLFIWEDDLKNNINKVEEEVKRFAL